LDLAIDQNWELDSMLVAAPAAHPKSSHDVDAMPAGIFGYPVVSLRFLLRAGNPGQVFSRAIFTMNSLMNFLRPRTPGMAEVPNSS